MHRHLLFYKPFGVLTQFTDRSDPPRRTLAEFIPVRGVYAVGRLDADSEGLLLLSSDGRLQHRWSDPKFKQPKTYQVQVEGRPGPAELRRLAEGLEIQGVRTRPAAVRALEQAPDLPQREPPIRYRASIPDSWIEITLTEGRNRQVRRMTAAVGFPTLRLVRVAIGPLTLVGLRPGDWRDLTPAEVSALN